MRPLELHLEVPRNGDYSQMWQLLDNASAPIDLTGLTLDMDARAIAGAGSIIASATITIDDAAQGTFNVLWNGADFASVQGATEVVRVAYDFKVTDGAGVEQIYVRGQIFLFPGVTA